MPTHSDSPGGNGFSGQRAAAGFARVQRMYATWRAAPSWLQRVLGAALLVVVVGVSAVLLVFGLAVGAVVVVLGGLVLAVRHAWARVTGRRGVSARADHTTIDGMRRNVRVIVREPPSGVG